MADATVTQRILVADPNIEVVTLDCTNAETYVSRKFDVVTHALVGKNDADDNHINVVTDGSETVTIYYANATDKDVTLVLFGKRGIFQA